MKYEVQRSIPQDVIILDNVRSQMVTGLYHKVVAKNVLRNYECLEYLLRFCRGEWLIKGSPWVGAKRLYAPINIKNYHWVGMYVDIEKG